MRHSWAFLELTDNAHSAWGEVVARAEEGEEIVYAEVRFKSAPCLTYSNYQVDVESVASVRGMIPTSKQRRTDLYSILDRWFDDHFELHDLFVKGQRGKVE